MAHILVIDDDQDILRLLEFALKRAGHHVMVSVNGVEGLARVEAQTPDLIVADVMMPKMTGYEFCRQVRARPDTAETPIIMFSARFQPIDRQTALEAGATDYLAKSASPEELIRRITEFLPVSALPATNLACGFFSLRGGVGVTSLAVNSAVAIAISHKTLPALVDLASLGGHAALMLGLRPTSSVVKAVTDNSKLSLDSLKPHFIRHNAGVQVLASDLNFEHQLSAYDQQLDQLAALVKSNFPFTIFDLPKNILEPGRAPILHQLDKIAVILSPDMPTLQSTAVALQGLAQMGITKNKIMLVLNQVAAHGALPLETIQKAVKRPIIADIPFEPDMIKAVNSGKPLLLSSPKCAGAAAIARLANTLLN